MIEESPNHFWLEQNPLKESKYWIAYKLLKNIYPDLYLFWEIKDWKFTGKLKIELTSNKKTMDQIIQDIIKSETFKNYKDIEEIEN